MRRSLRVNTSARRVPHRRRWAATWLVALVVLSSAACADKQEPTVASAAGGGAAVAATATATTTELAAYVQGQREWVACLRKQGLAHVPDPDKHGTVDIVSENPADTSEARALNKAFAACRQWQRQMSEELAESLEPPLTAAQIAAAKTFAECMRTNGVPEFPDPKANGRFDGAGPEPGMPIGSDAASEKASNTCMQTPEFLEAFPD